MKNIVLDLDQTLICSIEDNEKNLKKISLFEKGHELKSKVYYFGEHPDELFWGVYRPKVLDFVTWCNSYFDNVIVWSAGTNNYVKHIVRSIWNEAMVDYPKIIWTREKCSGEGDDLYKNMKILFKDSFASRLGVSRSNTLILDDNLVTYSKNKRNTFWIHPFEPDFEKMDLKQDDTALTEVKEWYLKYGDCEDIREIPRDIFKKRK